MGAHQHPSHARQYLNMFLINKARGRKPRAGILLSHWWGIELHRKITFPWELGAVPTSTIFRENPLLKTGQKSGLPNQRLVALRQTKLLLMGQSLTLPCGTEQPQQARLLAGGSLAEPPAQQTQHSPDTTQPRALLNARGCPGAGLPFAPRGWLTGSPWPKPFPPLVPGDPGSGASQGWGTTCPAARQRRSSRPGAQLPLPALQMGPAGPRAASCSSGKH